MSADLDALAVRMLQPAAQLVPAVQAGNASRAHAVLERLDLVELRALAVVLADWAPDPSAELLRRVTHVRLLCQSGEAARIRHRAFASRQELAEVRVIGANGIA